MTTTFNKFEEVLANKLGEIQTKTSYNIETILANAIPIWVLLGLTEEEYNIKYPSNPPDAPVVSPDQAEPNVVEEGLSING
jgi:hypothetical protein